MIVQAIAIVVSVVAGVMLCRSVWREWCRLDDPPSPRERRAGYRKGGRLWLP